MIGALMAKRHARKRFAARAENNVDAFLTFFADDAVFKFPGESPVGGTFRGREAIRAQFEQFRDRTADARFELVNVFVNRLQGMPDATDRRVAEPTRLRHPARAPLGGAARGALQRADDHLLHLVVGDPSGGARPRFVEQPVEPILQKARPPLADGRSGDMQPCGDARGGSPIGAGEDDARATRQVRRTARAVRERFEFLTFVGGQLHLGRGTSCAHAHLHIEQCPRRPRRRCVARIACALRQYGMTGSLS
jgi:hypothetical protein